MTAQFNKHKSRLFSLAYKLLGTVTDAEDVLQETWLRWQKLDKQDIQSPASYLSRIVTNLSIDLLRARKSKQTEYTGPWLPEPIATDPEADPAHQHELANDLSIAMLFLLERLKPTERAVFILKEALDFSHAEIAETLDLEIPHSRQLLSRAKKGMAGSKVEPPVNTAEQKHILTELMGAFTQGDITKIKSILTEDAVAYSDGGGFVSAAIIPLEGPDRIIQVFSHLLKISHPSSRIEWLEINGELGVSLYVEDKVASIVSIEFSGNRIKQIFIQRNPEKLTGFSER